MTWYAERRTIFGTWAPEVHPDPPHGREEDHPGEIAVKGISGTRYYRRIHRVPWGMQDAPLEQVRDLFAEPDPEPLPEPTHQPIEDAPQVEDQDIDRAYLIREIALQIVDEVERAERKHRPLNSPHEAWSVIYEELEELREHVRGDTGRGPEARKEAIQVAAMGLRYVLNLCAEGSPRNA